MFLKVFKIAFNNLHRYMSVFDTNQINAEISKDEFVYAGPMLLAKNGIFFPGEWSCLKPTVQNKIIKNIESGKVQVEGTTFSHPLECAVWTTWMISMSKLKDAKMMKTVLKYVCMCEYAIVRSCFNFLGGTGL